MGNDTFKFDVSQFNAEINQRGTAKPSNFYVVLTPPVPYGTQFQYLPLRIASVNIPGRSLNTTARQYIGPKRDIPMGFTCPPIQITVLLSDDMRERQLFLNWQDILVGNIRTGGAPGDAVPGVFDIGYYETGVGTMDIYQFAEAPTFQGRAASSAENFVSDAAKAFGLEPNIVTNPFGFNIFGNKDKAAIISAATKTTVHELYPFTINDVDMGWTKGNEFAYLTVEFRSPYYTEQHKFADPNAQATAKSAFRRAVEGFGRLIPSISLIKNLGFAQAAASVGGAFKGQTDSLIGTFNSVNPFD